MNKWSQNAKLTIYSWSPSKNKKKSFFLVGTKKKFLKKSPSPREKQKLSKMQIRVILPWSESKKKHFFFFTKIDSGWPNKKVLMVGRVDSPYDFCTKWTTFQQLCPLDQPNPMHQLCCSSPDRHFTLLPGSGPRLFA